MKPHNYRGISSFSFVDQKAAIAADDIVNPELHLFNSYDVTWPFTVLLGAFRSVCGNGLVVGKKFLHFKRRHVYELESMGLEEEVETALNRFGNQAEQWRHWAGTRLTEEAFTDIIEAMKFGKKATNLINGHIGNNEPDKAPDFNLWEFYNVITWYITHHAASLNHRVAMESRLRAAMMGF